MNQILVSEKVYVTPELKRKRKTYKVIFILCLILIVILACYYVLAEYDKNQKEQISKEILEQMNDDTTVEEQMIVVALDDNVEEESPVINIPTTTSNTIESEVTANGKTYTTEAILEYPKLGINYPVLSEESEELLKVSLCKYWGPNPNKVGNYCIVGHNYRNGKMFGRLNELVNGDIVVLKDMTGRTVQYAVYDRYIVDPTDTSCTTQRTNGRKEVTLITCTPNSKKRIIVKSKEIV